MNNDEKEIHILKPPSDGDVPQIATSEFREERSRRPGNVVAAMAAMAMLGAGSGGERMWGTQQRSPKSGAVKSRRSKNKAARKERRRQRKNR
jgi:hypothetical protein